MQLVKVELDVVSNSQSRGRSDAHEIVGHHFGRAKAQSGVKSGVGHELGWAQARSWAITSHVLLPSPTQEPLLVLALLLWGPPGGPPFPLLGQHAEPLTVLGAYKLCKSEFKSAASLSNENAVSKDGDLLEALAHAATTLASFSCGLSGTKTLTFLTFLWCLIGTSVSPQDVAILRTQATTLSKSIAKHTTSLALIHMPVLPVLPPTNSRFPLLLHQLVGVKAGFLEPPSNKTMRDAHFDDIEHTEDPRVVMKCVEGGLNSDVFEGCLLRVPDHANVLVLLTLSTQKDGSFEKASKLKRATSLVNPRRGGRPFAPRAVTQRLQTRVRDFNKGSCATQTR
jgi:hypothetical protein